jgi:hypothetical protein
VAPESAQYQFPDKEMWDEMWDEQTPDTAAARPWVITDDEGKILARFATDEEARDALDTGDYDHIDTHFGTQIAYVNE